MNEHQVRPTSHRILWILLTVVLVTTFTILGFLGREIYRQAPPIPTEVLSSTGQTIFEPGDIIAGQEIWGNIGGQTIGSIWGHGAYQAPDWTADWLHKEALGILNIWAKDQHDTSYEQLTRVQQVTLEGALQEELHGGHLEPGTGILRLSEVRTQAVQDISEEYAKLFGEDENMSELRAVYAFPANLVRSPERRRQLAAFVFWTAWASVTRRPGLDVSYTQNWPHEPLVANYPSTENLFWSFISIVLLLAGIGALVWYYAFGGDESHAAVASRTDPLMDMTITPSMYAVTKYVLVITALFFIQIVCGAVTAHYTVEGDSFFGFPLPDLIPYTLGRTWHVQLAMFWIATAFLAMGLFLAPAVGGKEPRFQKLGVDILFGALVVVVFGSLIGEGLALNHILPPSLIYWLGHQGLEFIELGRVWQIGLYTGLLLWLLLMLRGLAPALARTDENRTIVWLFTASAAAIGLFYGTGLMFGARTHLSVIEYWRWWVVHLWVEGFMEVFATAAVAFIFSRLGLIRPVAAGRAVLLSTSIFLVGGIPGTFHHIYFSGTPSSVMAVGATFSALEVVPLVLIGYEAAETMGRLRAASWMKTYKWPIRFFVAVSFWNFVGAGLFGFLINPPVALFYMQGLNTTAVHGHTALFGVYGFLALGMNLLVLRRLKPEIQWNESLLAMSFWGLNGGLVLMVLLSLLPIGLLQTYGSIEQGLWWVRSAEFMQQDHILLLKWLRMPGDVVFMIGAMAYAGVVVQSLFLRVSETKLEIEQGELQQNPVELRDASVFGSGRR